MFKTVLTIAIFIFGLSATGAMAQQSDRAIAVKIKAAQDAVTVACIFGPSTYANLTITYSEKMGGVLEAYHYPYLKVPPEVFLNGHTFTKEVVGFHVLGLEDRVNFTEDAIMFDNGSVYYKLDRHTLTLKVRGLLDNSTNPCHEVSR